MKLYTIIIIALTFLNCSKSTNKNESSDIREKEKLNFETEVITISKDQYKNESLSMTSLVAHSFGTRISSTGVIDVPPNGRAVISAQIGGYIKNSPLLIGDQVKKGQLLLSIENIKFLELQQQYMEAKEQLVFLKSNFDRQQELFNEKISSEKSFLKAESDYKITLATYKGLRKKLELLHIDPAQVESGNLTSVSNIFAPISGDITDINITTGSYVSSSDEIMAIVNTDHLHLELKIFEKDVFKIKTGQTVFFSLPESGSKQFKGSVHLIGKSIGSDRTVMVHAHIDEPHDEGFIPGMFVQASILTNESSGMGVLNKAVFEKNGLTYIMLMKSGENDTYTLEKIKVETGETSGDIIMIKNHDRLDSIGKYLVGGSHLFMDQ
ncbi:efflux RND transporter periplasmic adaptor subunit [Lutimonas halocynthiae]|uniref:efflux RND transporter periplasmic adaptor subunit n=1 Tax=Lutimonas halocynthiae TaxID=1446477 RepID=UPI0025B30987|nr:efflux RND transporter periplasmic adaptor subunit [Lutimonas halocynthiae]MDN3644078.1 efflux RND transporter periplasmic adaptor subunit [Lutimonas halocynthiae]